MLSGNRRDNFQLSLACFITDFGFQASFLTAAAGCAALGFIILRLRTAAGSLAGPGLGWIRGCRRYAAGAGAFTSFAAERTQYYAGGTTDACLHSNGIYRTVDGAGTALDAGVLIGNNCLLIFNTEYSMRADDGAHAAAGTGLIVKSQGYYVF